MPKTTRKSWRQQSRRTLVDTDWVKHHVDTIKLPSGKSINFHALEFPMKVAGVVAVGTDGKVLLTLQYRYMAQRFSWEIPAGNIAPGETTKSGARRELLEETGYRAKSLKLVYEYYPQIGRSNHYFYLFIARSLRQVSKKIDADEVCAVRWFPLSTALGMVHDGTICDGFTALALLMYSANVPGR